MTPQEFFKKDCFADKAGVELIEIKEGLTLGEFIFEKVQDDTMKKELHMNLLSQMLPNKESVKKKNKL